jgi:hypothetical protein
MTTLCSLLLSGFFMYQMRVLTIEFYGGRVRVDGMF